MKLEHTEPDYYGRCTRCGERLEAPSQAMRDKAAREGGEVVTWTARFCFTREIANLAPRRMNDHPCEAQSTAAPEYVTQTPEET